MKMFMLTMTTQTITLIQSFVIRNNVVAKDVLLNKAPEIEKNAVTWPSKPSSNRFAGLISRT